MTAFLLAINGINKILDGLNLGLPAGLKLYKTLMDLTKGTSDPLPDLPDSAVIALLKQRSEDNREWAENELDRINEIIANEGASDNA